MFADSFTSFTWILLAAAILSALIVVRRSAGRAASEADEAVAAAAEEIDPVESRPAARVANLEVHLDDFAREVEARIETRTVQLDGLIAAADREIIRLTDLLHTARGTANPREPDIMHRQGPTPESQASSATDGSAAETLAITGVQQQMVCHLHDAGYSVPEIAHIVGKTPDEVSVVLRAA
jgi:hypothetical protein